MITMAMTMTMMVVTMMMMTTTTTAMKKKMMMMMMLVGAEVVPSVHASVPANNAISGTNGSKDMV